MDTDAAPQNGACVGSVVPGSPAGEALIRPGWAVVAVDGTPTSTYAQVVTSIVRGWRRCSSAEDERSVSIYVTFHRQAPLLPGRGWARECVRKYPERVSEYDKRCIESIQTLAMTASFAGRGDKLNVSRSSTPRPIC